MTSDRGDVQPDFFWRSPSWPYRHRTMARRAPRDELILYATPEGDVGEACARYWATLERSRRRTTAQEFPPHCTLTGFFHRDRDEVGRIVGEIGEVLASTPDSMSVRSARLEVVDDWVGLVLDAPVFDDVIERFVARHRVGAGDDRLRPKTWLHLSLAYGAGADTRYHREAASSLFGETRPETWSVALWQRRDGRWLRLGP